MGQELIKANVGSFAVSPAAAQDHLAEVQAVIKDLMKPDLHYGVIPGAGKKPTLLKPGAELLLNLYQFFPRIIDIVEKVEQFDVPVTERTFPLFRYLVRVTVTDKDGNVVAVGVGECNSYESKYRWRDSKRVCPVCGKDAIIKGKEEYGGGWLCFEKKGGCKAKFKTGDPAIESQKIGRSPNEDIFDIVNTILKMAKKRALIDAALTATRTSGEFTQDIEDFKGIASLPETEYVDVTTGEVGTKAEISRGKNSDGLMLALDDAKPAGARDIIPMGLYKGKKLGDLTETQKVGLLKWAQESGEAKNHPEFMTYAASEMAKDAFGGAFEQQSPPIDNYVPQVQDDPDAKDKLLAEMRELLSVVVPKFAEPKPKLSTAEKQVLSNIVRGVYGVDSWLEVKKLSVSALKAGMEKLTIASRAAFEAEKKNAPTKGAK